MSPELLFVIALALTFEFLNGMRDASNIVATMISSRAFHPQTALGLTAIAEFLGPFLFGVVVAKTIGGDIVDAGILTLDALIACLMSAIIWNLFTWFFGIPSSSTHALMGGLIGVVMYTAGIEVINTGALRKIFFGLFFSPVIGFAAGFVILRLINFLARTASPNINQFFKRGQLVTALGLAFSHGTNDAQKTMGIIALSLLIGGYMPSFGVPFWVITISAATMALGTVLGGWRLIRTLGGKFYKIRPVHSFSIQLTSALVVLLASLLGTPVSTTQVVSSAIVGVGSSERFSKVRWSTADDILTAWILTIPVTGLLSAGLYWLLKEI